MKLRDPKTIRRVAVAGSYVARAWYRTLSYAYRPLTRYLMGDRPDLLGDARYVYAFWHEYLFVPSYVYARPDTAVLIGQHADGELLTHMNERFGFKIVRGSTTRGGPTAMLRMVRDAESRHFGLTPDGPKGPRRKCQFGAVYLASRTGAPIVPVGFGYSRCWRVDNWDRFALPAPFSRVRCVTTHPIFVPPDLSTKKLEPYQQAVEDATNQATAVAENWAETREFDPLGYVPPPDADVNPAHWKAWPSARLSRRPGRDGAGSPR
ncbi:MAG TPA: lysophospholipid acyltransferase family protein [Gemmataceae bacterium]|nr:lysophospholipid acyltransferase family protein [Gemmataceae bacterium]